MRQVSFIQQSILFFVAVLCFHYSSQAQIATVYWDGEQHGRSHQLNQLNTVITSNVFGNDELSSIILQPGYKMTVWEHNQAKGRHLEFVGYAPNLYNMPKWDGENWDNEISNLKIEPLPAGWDKPAELATGIYRIYNPYFNAYLNTGDQGGTNTNVTASMDHRLKANNSESIQFLVFPSDKKKGYYTFFSVSSGKNIMLKGSTDDGYTIKNNDQISSADFNGNGLWNQFRLKPVGMNRFEMNPKGRNRMAVTFIPGSHTPAVIEGNRALRQQWVFELVQKIDDLQLKPNIVKNENAPSTKQYSLLEFINNETMPHKEMSIQVPFYFVPDTELSFNEKMNSSPYYTLERKEFVRRRGFNDGWMENQRNESIKLTEQASATNTNERSGSRSETTTNSVSTSVSASIKTIIDISIEYSFSKEIGLTNSWMTQQSNTMTRGKEYTVAPCSKGAVFAIANKITIKRANGDVVHEIIKYNPNSVVFREVPLNPKECPNLRSLGEEAYQNKLKAYNDYMSIMGNNGNPPSVAAAPTTPQPNNPVPPKPVSTSTTANPNPVTPPVTNPSQPTTGDTYNITINETNNQNINATSSVNNTMNYESNETNNWPSEDEVDNYGSSYEAPSQEQVHDNLALDNPTNNAMPSFGITYQVECKLHPGYAWTVQTEEAEGEEMSFIAMWDKEGGVEQQFQLVDAGNGLVAFMNSSSGQAADFNETLLLWEYNQEPQQLFRIVPDGNGYFYLAISSEDEKVLQVEDGMIMLGTPQQNAANQLFKFVPAY